LIAAIIQARMGSSRLPGKVLADVCGRPMLQRLIERVRATPQIEKTIVATTVDSTDDELAEWVVAHSNCAVYRGSETDVLDRYYQCAKIVGASIIVRVTADDPLKDPAIISRAIELLHSDVSLEYCSNTILPTFPEGLDIEVFRFAALERAHREARLPSDREHVTPYIWRQPDLFKIKNFEFDRDLSAWRWTVDKPEDLAFIREIYTRFLHSPLVSYLDVIALLENEPQLLTINEGTQRNEGYLKTLYSERL
jgi:spore coat polysaccharide biosynthesis protein SpsF